LPQEILDISQRPGRHGSFNIHASLLPRWRGAAPIQRAIEAGDSKTGVCIMQMDAGLDTGDTVLIEELEIAKDEISTSLHDKLATLGAKLIVKTLAALGAKEVLTRTPQQSVGVTYAEKILKKEAEVDWTLGAKEIDARIRAFNPFPGAVAKLNEQVIKLWSSALANVPEVVLEIQKPGGKRVTAKTLHAQDHGDKPMSFDVKTKSC
jgi:methionyl-tRNA formyltransferase